MCGAWFCVQAEALRSILGAGVGCAEVEIRGNGGAEGGRLMLTMVVCGGWCRQHRPGVLCPAGMRGGARYPWDASPVDYEGEWSMQLVRSCERDVHVVEGRA